jgi:TDG/mug DNA glycosylase family protein
VANPEVPPGLPRWPRPSRAECLAAYGGTVPDLVAPGLNVLLCGINPSLMSAAIGHHFGNPANRLWPALHLSGWTPRRLHPTESAELLGYGVGITNLVARATATAAELTADEIRAGVGPLTALVETYAPRYVAFLGLTSYRIAFARPKAEVGPQLAGPAGAKVWLLPNPSGLNAHYQLPDLAAEFARLRAAAYADPLSQL